MNYHNLLIFVIFWCFTSVNAQSQHGLASVRPLAHEGVMTKSGERFSHDSLVAAHRSLPFGSLVEVTNLKNRQAVEVKINDRGPFINGRIIDLSERAADSIGVYKNDIAQVKIVVLNLEKNYKPKTNDLNENPIQNFAIQVASYSEKENAVNYAAELSKYNLNESVTVKAQPLNGKLLFKVYIGNFKTREIAEKYKIQLPEDLQNSYITTLNP